MSNISPALTPKDVPASPRPAMSPHSARRRREKVQLSCSLCRRRKLKCDRGQPCGTCTRRGLSLSCVYVRSASQRSDPHQAPPVPPGGMQDRITQLEGLVISLMSSLNAVKTTDQTPPTETPNGSTLSSSLAHTDTDEAARPHDPAQLSASLERISLGVPEASYVDSENWTAILDGIGALKDHFEDDPGSEEYQQPPVTKGADLEEPDLLFGGYGSATKQQILAAMPPRPIVDRLVAKCFTSMDMAPVIIHSPTFLKQYEQFWNNPMDTPLMWVGLLFGIMCSGTLYQQLSPNESDPTLYLQPASDPKRLAEIYRAKTIQCLVLRKYNQNVPYTIETFLLYLHADFLSGRDAQTEIWLVLGLIVRIAQRMGYHRNATHHPRISAFQAEMRRRVWAVIIQLEVIASARCGLPRMLRDPQCDAAEPRNLLDEDFDEDMVDLPPARPDTSFTAVQYFVAKNKIVSAFGLITDLETSIQSCSYAEVMRLDGILHDAYDSLPHWLLMRPMSQLIMDSPDAIMRRMYTALLFHKAKCVLHRKYLLPARTDSSYTYSHTTCVEAALQILQCQQILDQETQPGGRLYQDRWKVSSLVKTDFFLATNILCMDLEDNISRSLPSEPPDTGTIGVVVHALTNSYQIWLRSTDSSRDARKAAELLNIVLRKAQKMATQSSTPSAENLPDMVGDSFTPSTDPSAGIAITLPPERSNARLYQGALAPMLDMSDTQSQTMGAFFEPGTDPFDFDDWDSGYQSQSIDEMTGLSLNYPLMFRFPT